MEAGSENRSKGRPRVFSEEELKAVGNGSHCSPRQRQTQAYAEYGRRRLMDWTGEDSDYPVCVLAEFGRIKDPVLFREAFSWYLTFGCDLTAKQSAKKLGHMRVGVRVNSNPTALYEQLLRTIDNHRLAYPYTSYAEVDWATALALTVVRKTWSYIP